MKRSFLLAATFGAAILGGSAFAQNTIQGATQGAAQVDAKSIDDWRTVDLGSGVSLDVPKAVGDRYKPADKEDAGLALFRIAVNDAGEMYCGLDKLGFNAPPLGMVRKRAVDFLTNGAPGIFCHGVGTSVREKSLQVTESRQGYPGSRCVASYTDTQGGKSEGDVIQARVVVGQDAVYVLTCTVRDQDQARAETDWQEIWRTRIAHVEDSLKLP